MIKNTKILLLLQCLTIIPLVVFMLIFMQGWFYLSAFVLVLLLFVILYKAFKKQPPINLSLLALLMGSFYFYGFYALGSTQAPQTFHVLKDGQSVSLFEFSQATKIDKICYFVGIDKNVNFSLEAQTAKGWQKFYAYESAYPYSFTWKCIHRTIKTDKILWRISKNQMMLHEVKFFYQGQNIAYKSNKKYLQDENNLSVDTGYNGGMVFDEIYFARTAYELGEGLSVYENTHPYLGKLLILSGIKAFGMTPFGWRFMPVLFAGFLIFMVYYFALHLFKEHFYAFVSAFLITYSFMHLSQSRIALIDTFGVLFLVVSYFYLYRFILSEKRSRLWISGVFFGLAVAVKWSAIFASLGFVLIAIYLLLSRYPFKNHLSKSKLFAYGFLSYGLLAFIVYVLSFWEIIAEGGSLKSIYLYNINMYNYHSTLEATHPYSSSWWSWILDIKPMGYYRLVEDGVLHSLNSLGNPAIFWLGCMSIFYLLLSFIWRRSLEVIVILSAFFALYLPYIFVGRLMFIYHFYYAVPFLILAIVWMFKDLIERFAWIRVGLFAYLVLVAGLFLAFYPILSAYGVDNAYVNTYLEWFDGWWF